LSSRSRIRRLHKSVLVETCTGPCDRRPHILNGLLSRRSSTSSWWEMVDGL
jgi:hypothetical protein